MNQETGRKDGERESGLRRAGVSKARRGDRVAETRPAREKAHTQSSTYVWVRGLGQLKLHREGRGRPSDGGPCLVKQGAGLSLIRSTLSKPCTHFSDKTG